MKGIWNHPCKKSIAAIIIMVSLSSGFKLAAINLGVSYWHSSLKEPGGGLRPGSFNSSSLPAIAASFSQGSYFLSTKLPMLHVFEGDDNHYGLGEASFLLGKKFKNIKAYGGLGLPLYQPNSVDKSPFLGSGNITPFVGVGSSGSREMFSRQFKWAAGAKFTLPLEFSFTDYNLLLGSWSGYSYGKISLKLGGRFEGAIDCFFTGANNLWEYQANYVDELDFSLGIGPSVSIKLGPGHYLAFSAGLVPWNYNTQSFSNLTSNFSEEKQSRYASLGYSLYF